MGPKILLDAIKNTGRRQVLLGLFLSIIILPLIVFTIAMALAQNDYSTKLIFFFFPLFLLFFELAGIYRFFQGVKFLNAETTDIYHIVQNNPEKIVWLYKHIFTQIHFYLFIPIFLKRSTFVIIGLDNKKKIALNPGNNENVELLLNFLKTKSPKATIGYNVTINRAFFRNPKSLIK